MSYNTIQNKKLVQIESISNYDLSDNKYDINLLDSYGSFYSINQQTILPNEGIIFEKCKNIHNLKFIENSNYIKIFISGIYSIYFSCQLENDSMVGLYINNKLKKITTTIGNNLIIINHIYKLRYGDKIYFKNISSKPLITLLPLSKLNIENQNVELSIFKISPLLKNYDLTDS